MCEGSVRLHITPFGPDALKSILPSTVLERCSNISYHNIPTFPEKPYAYIDMPAEEATMIKKKLNGTILKGKKIRIEDARPKKRTHDEVDSGKHEDTSDTKPVKASTSKSKKSKPDTFTMPGRELSPDRKVKRGWTEVKDGKSRKARADKTSRAPSRFTDKEELLFRTHVPPDKKDLIKTGKKNKKKRAEVDLVHEFENSTIQPSFLRSGGDRESAQVAEFVDGKGWVDQEGNVVEPENIRASEKRHTTNDDSNTVARNAPRMTRSTAAEPSLYEDGTAVVASKADIGEADENTSISGSSVSEAEDRDSGEEVEGLEAKADGDEDDFKRKEASIHPLEALFKKPANPTSQDVPKPSLEVETSFSFFNAEDEDSVENKKTVVPDTPFSSQDGRYRELRSAAPTPDTAHPSRFSSYGSRFSSRDLGEESDEEDDGDETVTGLQTTPSKPSDTLPVRVNEFEKSFWENRGENNRTWKRRRREVNKENRQRENRASRRGGW